VGDIGPDQPDGFHRGRRGDWGTGRGRTRQPELNPDDPATRKNYHNTMCIVLAQMVTLPPRSRAVAMGRIMSKESGQEWLRSVMVEPVPMKTPGVYVARVVSHVFERIHQTFCRLSDAHRSRLGQVQGVPEENGEVRVVTGSQGDREN